MMKRLLRVFTMALTLVTAAAVSAFCANVAGDVSGPLSGVHLSFARPSVQVLAQAGSNSGDGARNPQSEMQPLVSDGLLKPGGGAEGPQANDNSKSNQDDNNLSGSANAAADAGHCKHGKHKGNKHCPPSPSQ